MSLDSIGKKESKIISFGNSFVAKGFTMYPVLILLMIVGSIVAPRFLTSYNLLNILSKLVLGLTTIGPTFILLIGRLDLSLEGLVGFAPMLAAVLLVPTSTGGFGTELRRVDSILLLALPDLLVG